MAHDHRPRRCHSQLAELQVMLEGVFEKRRFLDLIRHFIVFEDAGGGKLIKKMAGYHQFHAVNAALKETMRAAIPRKSAKQGSRRSRALHAGPARRRGRRPARRRGLAHAGLGQEPDDGVLRRAASSCTRRWRIPTLVVLTDRNDLDDQLFGTFARCHELLRQTPVQADDRDDLRAQACGRLRRRGLHHDPEVLPRGEGRPSSAAVRPAQHRRHRRRGAPQPVRLHRRLRPPHARRPAERLVHRLHRHAIEKADANTRAVFGDYISVYDIQRAVEDGATVPIYYESRLAKLELEETENAEARPGLRGGDRRRGSRAQGEAQDANGRSWRRSSARTSGIRLIAADLVEHFENRLEAMDGKAMVVCMSRRICVELYDEIVKLRPEWHSDDDDDGVDQDRHDRLGLRPARMAAAHPQQIAA